MKRMTRLPMITIAAALLSGCATKDVATRKAGMMETSEYQQRATIETSLFKSDQDVIGEDAIAKILSSKLQLPKKAKIALMRFPSAEGGALRSYGYYYWRSEAYLKTQQEYIDRLQEQLTASTRVTEAIMLPSLLTPKDATIPVLREAAVRLQADLLLVFRITSDTYYKYMVFTPDEVKAYSTCEAVLLDVKTGLIPFTTIATKDLQGRKTSKELEISETMQRVEKDAVLESLNEVATKLTEFLGAVP